MNTSKRLVIALSILILFYIILLIPIENTIQPKIADKKQYIWDRDSLWFSLETAYANSKKTDSIQLNAEIFKSFTYINTLLDSIENTSSLPTDPKYINIENALFHTAPLVGVSKKWTKDFINLFSRIRSVVKKQSLNWDLKDLNTRRTLYELLYGGRAAVEELILQDNINIPSMINGNNELSATPSAEILGARIHSGDILISRGGAPTSALIARGSDYPGNFSHVALVYINEKTRIPYIIEAHIERGVVVSTVKDYLNDKKLRIMVLRMRADHPKMIEDKMLPHKAAKLSYERAIGEHIPYDFEMNYQDNSRLFCSEVASSVYKYFGVDLWMSLSSISSKGTAKWLAGFGVKHFETQEPSDLEYDPQLTVVVEWRDTESLFKDHLDNSIIEALLEKAESGDELSYDWYMLPFARILKLYSAALNIFDEVGPVPEGMSAESALRHKRLVDLHSAILIPVVQKAKYYKERNGYTAPYWRLVEFARQTIEENSLSNL